MSKKDEEKIKQVENDIRKTVKNKKGKINKKNKSHTVYIIFVVILIIIAIGIIVNNFNKKVKNEEIKEYNYFIFSENDKIGVIDKSGKIIINAEYEYVQIPNPEKPIFICLYNYNAIEQEYSSKVLNEKGNEIYTKYNSITAIPNNNSSNNLTYQTSILQYKENNKYGLITIYGKKIISANYDSISSLEYKDEVLKVSKNNLYGLIDFNGKEIIPIKYDTISTDGYENETTKYEKAGYIVNIKTEEGYRYGYIDYNGKEILQTKYNSIKRLTQIKIDNTAYLITYENGKAGLYNNSKNIIKNEYESIEYDNINQLLALEKTAKYGIYDLYGNMILPIQYEDIMFSGLIINAHKDGELLIFDATGNIQRDSKYINIIMTDDSKYYITIDKEENYGVIDKDKNILVKNEYSYIEYLFDNYFSVIKNNKVSVIDYTGNIIIQNNYNLIQKINGTNIIQAINSTNNKTEIYNKKLEKVAEEENVHIYVKEQYVKIISDNNIIYLDFDGNIKEQKDIFLKNEIFSKKEDNKWGYVDKNGKVIVEFKYDIALDINECGFGAIKKDGKWGVVNNKGEIIKEPTYELKNIEPSFIGQYYKMTEEYEIAVYSKEINKND